MKQAVYVSGLPRSGSTLLCQLLGMHPDIYSTNHSSPLVATLDQVKRTLSDDPFLLSQLDTDFDLAYDRIRRSMKAFLKAWLDDTEHPFAVDKSRGWLPQVEILRAIDPTFKMLVCIRDLGDIFASIEKKHRETILLDFPDHMASGNIQARVNALFADQGVIGSPLLAIQNLQDITNQDIHSQIYFVAYEALVENPVNTMQEIYHFIGADKFEIDPENLVVKQEESDSYYRYKYPHKVKHAIMQPSRKNTSETISLRIRTQIINKVLWYYQDFYPIIARTYTNGNT